MKSMPTPLSTPGGQGRLDRMIVYLCFTLWIAHGTIATGRTILSGIANDPGSLLARMCTTVAGVVITLIMWRVLRRWRGGSVVDEARRAALLSVAACAVHAVLNQLFFMSLSAINCGRADLYLSAGDLSSTYLGFIWIFLLWSGLYAVLVGSETLRLQDRAMADARDAAQQARLAALRYQVQPHFLFNSLNAISSLIGEGRAREADEALLRLAAFYRHTLAAAPREFVPLAAEVDAQRMYLAIEKVRFADRLESRITVDPQTEGALAPSLILQPFVENAVKHGVACSSGTTTVTILAQRVGDRLRLVVEDDARPEGPPAVGGLGRSLQNVRLRLDMLYDGDFELVHGPSAEGGWRVVITLPFDVEAAP